MLFERTHRIFLKTLQQAGGMCRRKCAADPVLLAVLAFLLDHTGKYGSMRRRKQVRKDKKT
jgi:hypothetical protein